MNKKVRLTGNRETCFLLFIVMCVSCSENIQDNFPIIINVDINKTVNVDIAGIENVIYMPLETNNESLLYEVKDVIYHEGKWFVHSKEKLSVFNERGVFLFNVGAKGQAPHEYLGVSSCFIQNGSLYLYDWEGAKMLRYTLDGVYLDYANVDRNERSVQLFPIDNGQGYIGRNTYRGVPFVEPAICFYDANYKKTGCIKTHRLNSGMKYNHQMFSAYKDEVLFVELFQDTIFAVKNEELYNKYYIDFGEKKMPPKVSGTGEIEKILEYVYDNMEFVQTSIASAPEYIQETDACVYAVFAYKQIPHFMVYHKGSHICDVYTFVNAPNGLSVQKYMKMYGNQLILMGLGDDSVENQTLISINVESLP